jgi:glutathione S-transferase
MSLTLYYHPLASFCWKPLIAFYEGKIPFFAHLVDLGDEKSRNDFLKIWPMGEFPVLHDKHREQIIPQSSTIIEYLSLYYESSMISANQEQALETRRWNEFYDNYLHVPMQKIVADCMRPAAEKDSKGVAEARDVIQSSYGILERAMKGKTWAVGDAFSMADCSASPALFYADKVEPLGVKYPSLLSYLERLKQRPSFARVLEEATPYFHMFPYRNATASS